MCSSVPCACLQMAVSHRVCWELDLYSSTLITPLFCSKNHVSTCLTLLNTFLYISCFLCFKPSDKKQVGRESPSSVLLASRVLFLFCFSPCHYVLQYKDWKVWKSLFYSQKHFTTRDLGKMISCLSCHVEGSDKSCKSLTSQPCFPGLLSACTSLCHSAALWVRKTDIFNTGERLGTKEKGGFTRSSPWDRVAASFGGHRKAPKPSPFLDSNAASEDDMHTLPMMTVTVRHRKCDRNTVTA